MTNQIFLNGSGVACGDVNGDGRVDILFAGLDSDNVLYLNQGHWRFEPLATSGLELSGMACTGVALSDLDGDGDLDAVINTIGAGTHVLFNDGTGRFAPFPGSAPLNPGHAGMSLAIADFDGDGDLDLYVVNYRVATYRDDPNTRFTYGYDERRQPVLRSVNGIPVTDASLQGRYTSRVTSDGRLERIENGEPDVLYLNDGTGRFTAVAWTDGAFLTEEGLPLADPPNDWGLGVAVADFNGDGRPDLMVANDFMSPDRWWLNQGVKDGRLRFRAIPRLAVRHTSYFSMGAAVGDVNRDGFEDVFVADMRSRDHARRMVDLGVSRPESPAVGAVDVRPQANHNTLQLNRGDGTFAEIAMWAGVDATDWSWAPAFLDVDLDGWEDLLITAGHERDLQHADLVAAAEAMATGPNLTLAALVESRRRLPRLDRKNLAFRNRWPAPFEDKSAAWGFDARGVSHGMAFADLDGDGDLDVVVNRLNEGALLLRNTAPGSRLFVRLAGNRPNTRGIGAIVHVDGGPVPQERRMRAAGHYLSSDDPALSFAGGDGGRALHVTVRWPQGGITVLSNVPPNSLCELFESEATAAPNASAMPLAPLFEDVSQRVNHAHWEDAFDDFQRQPLLPRRYSQEGPGAAWADLDGDGREDLVITAGTGGRMAILKNHPDGSFRPWTGGSLPVQAHDTLGLLAFPGSNGVPGTVIAGVSRWQGAPGAGVGGAALEWAPGNPTSTEVLDGLPDGCGVLVLADFDDDGVLELFAGGRYRTGRFPEAAPSALYRRGPDGRWVTDSGASSVLLDAGRVNGACATDLDGDGRPELVLACEWGPVRIFQWKDRGLIEVTAAWGLDSWTGLWRGVASGDFDGDGRPDLVVSNVGLNTEFCPSPGAFRELDFGEWGGVGAVQSLEVRFDAELGKRVPIPRLDAVAAALPSVRERFPSHEAFSHAHAGEIPGTAGVRSRSAATFASCILLNRGNRFEVRPLPPMAQWAVGTAVVVEDFNGDGLDDVFLGQNFFPTRPEDTRSDAGLGLLLLGDGRGGFRPAQAMESGLRIWGDQRGAAAADFDGDGRMDLVVTQNGAATRLFRNVGARPGLRVRLKGPSGNPSGVGAVLVSERASGASKITEVQAGSGWLGQGGAVRVIPGDTTSLTVRWPGGATSTVTSFVGEPEVVVPFEGRTEVSR